MKSTTSRAMETEFGFYPHPLDDVKTKTVTIHTLPKLETKVKEVCSDKNVEKGWIYSPPQEIHHVFADLTQVCPYPARVFGLPKTHKLVHHNTDNLQHVEFLVWVLSFFVGMRLSTTEAGFVDATPIKYRTLTDFTVKKDDLSHVLSLGDQFWQNNTQDRSKLFRSAIHTLFISHNPQFVRFRYESFIFAYIALDTCWLLSKEKLKPDQKKPNHTERIQQMCETWGIPCPKWDKDIVTLRNFSLHEGLHLGEPLGYSRSTYKEKLGDHLSNNPIRSMQKLVCRLLVAIIEVNDKNYIQSSCDNRSIHLLDLAPPCPPI